jgi:hypothetical protein
VAARPVARCYGGGGILKENTVAGQHAPAAVAGKGAKDFQAAVARQLHSPGAYQRLQPFGALVWGGAQRCVQ